MSFLADLTVERAQEWWRDSISSASPRSVFLVARDAGQIVGTVQLRPAWAPNQPHRAEIEKLPDDRRMSVVTLLSFTFLKRRFLARDLPQRLSLVLLRGDAVAEEDSLPVIVFTEPLRRPANGLVQSVISIARSID